MGRPKKIKTEPSSFYDGSFAFDQCSALFNNSLHMMQQSSMSPMTTMTPFGLCCPDQKCTDPKCMAGHPRSPSGTDSGFESDGGVSGMHSPVSLQAPRNLGASPTHQRSPTDFSMKSRQVPFNGTPFPNTCFDQSTAPTIKTEPMDVYECNSMYGQSPTNTSYQSNMADCSQMFQQGSSPMCATEMTLSKEESDNVAEEVDLDDINDILCTLGQFLDSSENQSKPKPEQYNQQCAVSSQNGNIYDKSQNSSYGQCTQNIHGQYNAQNTSTQYPYGGTQYQSAMQSYPQSSMQNCYQGQQWSSTQQPMTTGSQSGYYSYSNMSGVPYTCWWSMMRGYKPQTEKLYSLGPGVWLTRLTIRYIALKKSVHHKVIVKAHHNQLLKGKSIGPCSLFIWYFIIITWQLLRRKATLHCRNASVVDDS